MYTGASTVIYKQNNMICELLQTDHIPPQAYQPSWTDDQMMCRAFRWGKVQETYIVSPAETMIISITIYQVSFNILVNKCTKK